MAEQALVVALLGAESTGKTDLARALAAELGRSTGLRVRWVPEHLRAWCDDRGRTPLRHEQRDIARAQTAAIDEAARDSQLVIADTTALMTALYSRHYFGDDALLPAALEAQRRFDLTLLCSPDGLPWQPDGFQRDGEATRARIHAELQRLLEDHGIAFERLSGDFATRLARLQALLAAAESPP